jgi:hypothetical protein
MVLPAVCHSFGQRDRAAGRNAGTENSPMGPRMTGPSSYRQILLAAALLGYIGGFASVAAAELAGRMAEPAADPFQAWAVR